MVYKILSRKLMMEECETSRRVWGVGWSFLVIRKGKQFLLH